MNEPADLWNHWQDAVTRPAIHRALGALYGQLDAAVAARNPTCWISGRCCDFNAYGHRLYVTGLEITWCLRRLGEHEQPGVALPQAAQVAPDGPCVFQRDKLCTIHRLRPLGCRLFFCQEGTQQWQQQTYEHFQSALRRLHDDEAIAYRYMEWRSGLTEALSASTQTRA